MDIRKISIGPDYKGGAMHYLVGQRVLDNTGEIHLIKFDAVKHSVKIYVLTDRKEVLLWKEFTSTIPISIEYNVNF